MTKDQYLEMCEQMGEEPDWDKCPAEINDFPDVVIDALNIYHSLGDRVYPDIGFVGKDYTNFNFLLERYNVQKWNVDFTHEIMMEIESQAITASQKRLKSEYDKIKNKK